MKNEIIAYLLGPDEPAKFIAAAIFAVIGILISLLAESNTRPAQSDKGVKNDFSWSYLLWDNAKRIFLSVLLILVTIRFAREIMGADLTMYMALGIGLVFDRLGLILKKNGLLGGKNEVPEKFKADESEKH